MKKFLLTLIVFSLVLLIGCQENFISEPDVSLKKKDQALGPIVTKEVIEICCQIQDPFSSVCELIGEVEYEHRIVENLTGLYEVTLHLDMDSELCDRLGMAHLEWGIHNISDDVVYVSEDGIYILDKVYEIENRMDIILVVQYLITTEGVGIPNLWIEEID